jgi:DNA-binding response OmpR family regulator
LPGETEPGKSIRDASVDDRRLVVVVADDDPDVRALIALHLRRRGCEVLEAADGVGALRLVFEHEPDLVVLDVRMPGLSGYEVTRELRSRLGAHVPVLLVSGSVQPDDVSEGFRAGADAYLMKPFAGEDLLEHVDALLAPGKRSATGSGRAPDR